MRFNENNLALFDTNCVPVDLNFQTFAIDSVLNLKLRVFYLHKILKPLLEHGFRTNKIKIMILDAL